MEKEGIILRTVAYGDSDLIVRVLTPEQGKLSLMARGARKSNRRFSGGLEMLDHGRFLLGRGKGKMPLVSSFSQLVSYPELRLDLDRLSCATFLSEVFDLLTHEDANEDSEAIFNLLTLGLTSLCESTTPKLYLRCSYLTIRGLLSVCGFISNEHPEEASSHALLRLIAETENAASQEVRSKETLLQVIRSLKKDAA